MKQIPLTQGKYTLVDDSDYEWLNQWKWYCNDHGYAERCVYLGGGRKNRKYKTIKMHRLINNTPMGFDTDHIDRNPLNNQRDNLRVATHNQNCMNRDKQKNNTSGFKGVNRHKASQKWIAQIQIKGKKNHLGCYDFKEEAILAYNIAVKQYFGEFAPKGIYD